MEYVYVGRIITTHGIKGEIKIRSNFKYKDKVFVVGNTLYIGKNYEERKILSYRVHKDYDMVMLDGLDDIDKVIHYKNLLVFVSKDQLKLSNNQYVNEDFINMSVYFNNNFIGTVVSINDMGNGNDVFVIKDINKTIYVPKNDNFIDVVDLKNNMLLLKNVEGLV